MAALKALVIFMGLLIAAAMGLIAWGLYEKAADPDFKPFASLAKKVVAEEPALRPFSHINIELPEGCAIANIQPDEDRLFVTIGPGRACTRIIIIDVARGRLIGTIGPQP